MITRRRFLRTAGGASLATLPAARLAMAAPLLAHQTDEWYAVQQAFAVDRSLTHLNNGGVCPAPKSVMDALSAHQAASNRRPFYAHQGEVAAQIESVRSGLANLLGCESEELALTRNTSEGMEICQLGIPMEAGDEIVTTDHDYPRMMQTWTQRSARDGIVIRSVPVGVPLMDPEDLVRSIEQAITPRTRLVMCCHMVDLTGQVLPIREIVRIAHTHGVPVLVDGAQTFGHLPFSVGDLKCDFYATSLHKWIMGPEGTGLLYVKREHIPKVWPLMPARAGMESDIRKFEDAGTRASAPFLALAEALRFHEGIGSQEKFDRLCYLRDYWLDGLSGEARVLLLTETGSAGALATVEVAEMDPLALRNHLWDRYRIRVRPIRQVNVSGIRVSPGIYTTLPELDRFVTVMKSILADGLPTPD